MSTVAVAMAKEKISIKFLIHLVGERPALWDKTSQAYKDRSLKETSWREICTFITDQYEHMQPEPKQEFTKMVIKKWTHIRDSWVKSIKYGYDEKTRMPIRPYIYHNDLKFMQKILKFKPTRYNFRAPILDDLKFEKFYNDKDVSENAKPCDDQEDYEDDENVQDEEIAEELKQDHLPVDDSELVVENHALEDDDDDWPVDDVTNPIIEIKREPNHVMRVNNFKNGNRTKHQPYQRNQVKKRTSIFKSFGKDAEENRLSKNDKEHTRPSTSYSSNSYLDENRHWSFFKGILPSVNTLDEDHTLEFQSNVLTLLQKLRNSQNCKPDLSKSTAKKHKANDDDDYEWPIHKVDISKRYSTRGSRPKTDPIGGEDVQFESENSCGSE